MWYTSHNIVVIIFAHIAEEILGIVLTPFWFLRDIFTHNMDDDWKIWDYITYAIEWIVIFIGVFTLSLILLTAIYSTILDLASLSA